MKVKSYLFELRNLLEETPSEKERYMLPESQINDFNNLVDILSKEINQDLSRYKMNNNDIDSNYERDYFNDAMYFTGNFRVKIGRLIGFLEGEFNIQSNQSQDLNSQSGITIVNTNTVAVTFNQTIQQLIEKSRNNEEREKLSELEVELNKPSKNWVKIKDILKWILDFSEQLFFKILPIILKHYGVGM